MTFRPVLMTWNASERTMRLEPRFARVADAQFVDGESYPVEVVEHRSSKEHAHFFASVKNAWDNISDQETLEVLSTPNKLRAWCLIQTGWCETTVFGPIPYRAAIKSAQSAAANFRMGDTYVEVTLRKTHDEQTGKPDGNALVIIKTPKSQSRASMKKEDFRASKQAVLEVLSGIIQVKRRDLEKSGRDSA